VLILVLIIVVLSSFSALFGRTMALKSTTDKFTSPSDFFEANGSALASELASTLPVMTELIQNPEMFQTITGNRNLHTISQYSGAFSIGTIFIIFTTMLFTLPIATDTSFLSGRFLCIILVALFFKYVPYITQINYTDVNSLVPVLHPLDPTPLEKDVSIITWGAFTTAQHQIGNAYMFAVLFLMVWAFSASKSSMAILVQASIPVLIGICNVLVGWLAAEHLGKLIDGLGLGALRRAGMLPSLSCVLPVSRYIV